MLYDILCTDCRRTDGAVVHKQVEAPDLKQAIAAAVKLVDPCDYIISVTAHSSELEQGA